MMEIRKSDGTKFTALIAEDKEINQLMAKYVFEQLGCIADFVKDGAQCLQHLKSKKYDVIFMDCKMPVMDGYEATKLIREYERENHELPKTPIIAITGQSFQNDREKCISAGMDDYITKPIRIERVSEAILKWCDDYEALKLMW
ncbi:response regulator [Rickettsiales bacterium]|nr:response regulator [Rickettsiales bacterium]